jgi:hypothetical protein
MNAPGGDQLRVARGQRIEARHHNGLVDFAQRLALGRGSVPGRSEPGGFTPMNEATATLAAQHDFKITVGDGDEADELRVTFTPGHVDGVIPMIGDLFLDDVDASGNPPALIVKAVAWRPYGRGERSLLMFRYELNRDFAVMKVVPVAVPLPPPRLPWQWHKLTAILIRREGSVRVFPMIFFSQGFDVADPRPATGSFQPLPRIV